MLYSKAPISAVCDLVFGFGTACERWRLRPCTYNYIMGLQQGVCIPWRLVYSIHLQECLCSVYMAFIMWTKEVNVPGNGGIVSDTVTFLCVIPWRVLRFFRKLVTCWSVRLRFSALFLTGSSRPQMFTRYAWYPDWQFFLPHWKKGE